MMKKGLVVLLALAAILLLFKWRGNSQIAISKIGSAGVAGHYYKLAQLLEQDSPQHLQAMITAGSMENLAMLEDGRIDFALIQSGLPLNNSVAAVATVAEQYVHLFVPANSPYASLREAGEKGALVGVGREGSGTLELGNRVFSYFPMDTEKMDLEHYAAEAAGKKPDLLFSVYSLHTPLVEQTLANGDYRLLPILMNQSIAEAIPGCYPAVMIPYLYGESRSIPPEPLPTLKVKTLLVTRESMDPKKVRHLLKVLYASKQPDFVELSEAQGSQTFGVPLHKAAAAYYRRNEPISADKFEIGGVLLAVMIFFVSAFQFWMEKRHERGLNRKRLRIRPYFEQLLELNNAIVHASVEELEEIMKKISTIQGKAEEEWLNDVLDTEHMENLYVVCASRMHQAEIAQTRLLQSGNTSN